MKNFTITMNEYEYSVLCDAMEKCAEDYYEYAEDQYVECTRKDDNANKEIMGICSMNYIAVDRIRKALHALAWNKEEGNSLSVDTDTMIVRVK